MGEGQALLVGRLQRPLDRSQRLRVGISPAERADDVPQRVRFRALVAQELTIAPDTLRQVDDAVVGRPGHGAREQDLGEQQPVRRGLDLGGARLDHADAFDGVGHPRRNERGTDQVPGLQLGGQLPILLGRPGLQTALERVGGGREAAGMML